MSELGWLRRQAVGWSLPRRGGALAPALADLEFVQADPIRAPARAQDLVLRQRVAGYRAGDLDRHYPSLDIDEDVLHAYGFVARRLRPFLYPRRDRHSADGRTCPPGGQPTCWRSSVSAGLRTRATRRPTSGTNRSPTAGAAPRRPPPWSWSGCATTACCGWLTASAGSVGTRRPTPLGDPLDPADRLRALVLRVARTLAPVSEATLSMAVGRLVQWAAVPGGRPGGRPVIRDLLTRGELAAVDVGGTRYVWPADLVPVVDDAPRRVRFLAPFDPVVWDRRRFGQLWGWEYRFEAYTRAERRVLGYYAMPLLWRDRVIGWATCDGGAVQVGYIGSAPPGRSYAAALEAEIARLKRFLSQA